MKCEKCGSMSVEQARLILFKGAMLRVLFCQACEHITRTGNSSAIAAYESRDRHRFTRKHRRKGGDK